MKTRMLRAGALAAFMWAGVGRADDAQQPPATAPQHDAAHAAMHDAMQQHMATPPADMAQMPGMRNRAAGDAAGAQEHAREMQQLRTRPASAR